MERERPASDDLAGSAAAPLSHMEPGMRGADARAGRTVQPVGGMEPARGLRPPALPVHADGAPTPPEAPLAMPVQDFRGPPPPGPAPQRAVREVVLARVIAFGGSALITALGFWQMLLVLNGQLQPLQYVLLVLFSITFGWVGFSFCSVVAGLCAKPPRTPADPGHARVAIVMPVYHEDASLSLSLLSALADELAAEGMADRAEIFILSDSRNPDDFVAETLAVAQMRQTCPIPVWYRRRTDNSGRKAGNVAEFVRRWGGRYDQMVVLDADSVMSGRVIAEMSARMAADPDLALVQTIPVLVGGQTIYARVVQFASRVYGPAVGRGVAAWSGDNGNFWGHNAMIRLDAFASCCGLPDLPGKPPFGGTVMSHDFVEAALLRRAGWKVRLDWDLRASYEGCPPTLLDMAVRERRWAQGNLQHLGVIGAKGFTAISRVHFAIGVLSFVISPIWLAMIVVGLALTAHAILVTPEYFPQTYQIFPSWPTFDPTRMKWLFIAAGCLLLLPKVVAVLRARGRPLEAASGGMGRLSLSALFEFVLSTLIAPVAMLIQSRQIFDILRGRNSGWESQVRKGAMPPWDVVWSRHWVHVLWGIVITAVISYLSPGQLIWLAPILLGLILSPLVSRFTASSVLGRSARMAGLLVTPEERRTPPVVTAAIAHARQLRTPDHAAERLGSDPALRARHVALLPPAPADAPVATRLPAIAAGAKIAVASSRAEALAFLDQPERRALFSDAGLLAQWAALPR